jgi:hypothetical protein
MVHISFPCCYWMIAIQQGKDRKKTAACERILDFGAALLS